VKKLGHLVPFLLLSLSSCADAVDPDDGFEDTEDAVTVVSDDDLNGIYDVTIDGAPAADAVIESWPAVGVRLTLAGKQY
jgi:hypothetical protein